MTNRSFVAVATAVAVIAASSGPTWPQASGGKDQPSIRLVRPGADVGSARFEVSGVDPASLERLEKSKPDRSQWTAVFAVFVDHRSNFRDDKQPALLGSHRVAEGVIVFEPKYRLEPGLRYRAVFDGAAVLCRM